MKKVLMFNDREFTSEDLFKLEDIEKHPESENEKFLCQMVEKFFFRMAQLQDDINQMRIEMEQV